MITQTTIKFVDKALKYSIKKTLPLDEKVLLYDALVFCSITSQTKMFCSVADMEAFKTLTAICKDLDMSLASYLGCAYNYISKYSTPGHRIGLSYFLNDKIISFCGVKMDAGNGDSLLVEQIKTDILTTEKDLRSRMSEAVSYNQAFGIMLKSKRLSNYFLAYKKFCESDLVTYSSEYFDTLVDVLEPFFTYILAKNQIYTPYKIKSWNNSKIEDYSFCPTYFTHRYITNELGDDSMGNASTDQGTAVHSIFENIIKKYTKNKVKNLKAIATKFFNSKAFIGIENDLSDHVPFIKDQFLNTDSFLHTMIKEDREILIEHNMNETLEGQRFYGTADLIIIDKHVAYILDYKTSKLDPKYLDKNNQKYTKQLSLYTKLLQKERPEITEVHLTLLYTRGLLQSLEVNNAIAIERVREIDTIKKNLKSGVIIPNNRSCFLCRDSICKFRTRESIWLPDGTRKPAVIKT